MGKQGPCCHCGISTTPLWRNGPAEKPVLCNACGSRWRTKGTLVNYMPMHSGGLGLKSGSAKKGTQKIIEHRSHKRKEPSDGFSEFYRDYQASDQNTSVVLEEDASTRSSTGSGISFSESCAQHTMTAGRASECWPLWGCHVPSKRRTIMHRHRPSAKRFSCSLPLSDPFVCKYSSEEDLLVEYKPSSMTVEIGLGGVFIGPPVSRVPAQESQASSLMCDNKEVDQSVILKSDITREGILGVHVSEGSTKHRGKEKTKQLARSTGAGCTGSVKSWMPNKTLLENFPYRKRDVLQSCHSPLVFVELKDIINFDTFMGLLTEQEQRQLVSHLSPADLPADRWHTSFNVPSRMRQERPFLYYTASLKSMFSSAQFESALRGFQALLSEGMFDSSESGLSPRVLQHYQQLLMLSDLTTSGWMERCSQILNRGRRKSSMDYAKIMQGKEYLKEKLKGLNALGADVLSSSADVVAAKNLPAGFLGCVTTEVEETPVLSVPNTSCKAPTPISSWSVLSDVTFEKDHQLADPTSKQRQSSVKSDGVEGEGRSYPRPNAKSFYPSNQWRKSPANPMEAPIYGMLEHDILLDLPSTLSFQQAELLQQPVWSKLSPRAGNDANQSNKNGDTLIQNTWPSEPNLDWSELLWNSPSAGSVNDTL